MNDRFLAYLRREHERLDKAITDLERRAVPDSLAIAALKKQKLAVKDQISQWRHDCRHVAA